MHKLTEQYIEQAVDYLFGDKTNANTHERLQATNTGKGKTADNTRSLCSWPSNRILLDFSVK